jgi:hypothetical protein
MPSEVHESEP